MVAPPEEHYLTRLLLAVPQSPVEAVTRAWMVGSHCRVKVEPTVDTVAPGRYLPRLLLQFDFGADLSVDRAASKHELPEEHPKGVVSRHQQLAAAQKWVPSGTARQARGPVPTDSRRLSHQWGLGSIRDAGRYGVTDAGRD